MSEVLSLRQSIINEIDEIKRTKANYTDAVLFRPQFNSERGAFDVRTATVGQLIEGYKSTVAHDKVCKALGFATNHLGYSIDEWRTNFIERAEVIRRNERLRTLQSALDKLSGIMTDVEERNVGLAGI